jgi:hypothetical protein
MGRILDRVLRAIGGVPAREMSGLRLNGRAWEVPGQNLKPTEFLRALPLLTHSDAMLFLEGGAHPPALKQFLRAHDVEGPPIARGTIWPRAQTFHVPTTGAVLSPLADLVEGCGAIEFCYHLHVYAGDRVLLEWHDAFTDAFLVSKQVPESRLRAFCERLALAPAGLKHVE